MSSHRGLDSDLCGFVVAYLADEHNVGVLPQDGARVPSSPALDDIVRDLIATQAEHATQVDEKADFFCVQRVSLSTLPAR